MGDLEGDQSLVHQISHVYLSLQLVILHFQLLLRSVISRLAPCVTHFPLQKISGGAQLLRVKTRGFGLPVAVRWSGVGVCETKLEGR